MHIPIGAVVCALLASLFFAVAAVAQQHAAAGVPEGEALMRSLVRSPKWWAGILGDGGGFGFQVAALALGSVLVVQPILVSSLIFALPLAARFAGRRISGKAWATAGALAVALACFEIIGDPSHGRTDAPFRHWVLPLTLIVGISAALAITGMELRDPGRRALLLGTAGGTLFGLSAALTQYVISLFTNHGIVAVLTGWETYPMIATGVVGVYLQQRAFQVGPLAASLPAVMITEPVSAAVVGMTALDQRLQTGPLGIAVIALSVAVMAWAAIVLSRAQAVDETVAAVTTT